jgi:hypothetical protein
MFLNSKKQMISTAFFGLLSLINLHLLQHLTINCERTERDEERERAREPKRQKRKKRKSMNASKIQRKFTKLLQCSVHIFTKTINLLGQNHP